MHENRKTQNRTAEIGRIIVEKLGFLNSLTTATATMIQRGVETESLTGLGASIVHAITLSLSAMQYEPL
jgi:hypothetical protein